MINNSTYKLPIDNYIPIVTNKKQIIIGNTFNKDMRHYVGWLKRFNGKSQKTASFTINKDGVIYNHFNPKFYSTFMGSKKINEESVIILLENEGWLLNDTKNSGFINWLGDIYNQTDGIVEKRWRGYIYWASYSEKQIEALSILVKSLCNEFNIPLNVIEHNTKIDYPLSYSGILYKSNYEKYFTDPSPAWDCGVFKEKIEN